MVFDILNLVYGESATDNKSVVVGYIITRRARIDLEGRGFKVETKEGKTLIRWDTQK